MVLQAMVPDESHNVEIHEAKRGFRSETGFIDNQRPCTDERCSCEM